MNTQSDGKLNAKLDSLYAEYEMINYGLEDEPGNIEFITQKAIVLQRIANLTHDADIYDEALSLFNEVLAVDPCNILIRVYRAQVYLSMGMVESAKKDLVWVTQYMKQHPKRSVERIHITNIVEQLNLELSAKR